MSRETNFKSAFHMTTKGLVACISALILAALAAPAVALDVHELAYNNSEWVDTDLSYVTNTEGIATGGGTAAFYTTPNDQRHIFYVDSDQFLHQLYYNGSSWADQIIDQLPSATGWVPAGITGFSIGNAQYVYLCASDYLVHEVSYGNDGDYSWVDVNLEAPCIGSLAARRGTTRTNLDGWTGLCPHSFSIKMAGHLLHR
jgi:hypothetical protein